MPWRKFWIPYAAMMRHNNYMKNPYRLFLLLQFIGIFAVTQPLYAAETPTERWYQIEVLVYEPVEHAIANERWPAVVNDDTPKSLIELEPIIATEPVSPTQPRAIETPAATQIDNAELIPAFQQLLPEELTLAETADKLIQAGRYRIITLQGWQQPVKQRHEADAVHLTDKPETPAEPETEDGKPLTFDPQGNIVLNAPVDGVIPPAQTEFDESSLIVEEIPARIDGSVTVSLSRYLHMALNIRYYNPDVYLAEQIALQNQDEIIIDTFELKQSRRMRSKEVHVFDHPYFGVIATIIPVERIVPETETFPSDTNKQIIAPQ